MGVRGRERERERERGRERERESADERQARVKWQTQNHSWAKLTSYGTSFRYPEGKRQAVLSGPILL